MVKSASMIPNHRKSVEAKLPMECVVRERVAETFATFRLTSWTTAYIVGLIFVAWLAEYLINTINFADWVVRRWYIPIGILGVTVYSCIRNALERNLNWQHLQNLSSPLPEARAVNERSPHATGPVSFGDVVIGHRTTTCAPNGLSIWNRGTPEVYFP